MTNEKKINVPKDVYLRNIFCCDCSLKKTCENDPCENYEHWKEGYEKGLAEGKPKWHDLREDPNDLPPASKEDDAYSEVVLSDDGDKVYCSLLFGKWYNYHTDRVAEVIAWTERPKFEEK